MDYCILGPDSHGITFVASTFAVVSFLCVLDVLDLGEK